MADAGVGFDWTIRAGDLLTMGGAIFVAFGILYRRGLDAGKQDDLVARALTELKEVKEEIKKFGDSVQKIAVQESQITMLLKWYDELRRGVGYIGERDQRRKSVDGEY